MIEQEIENLTPDFVSIPGFLAFINKDGKVMSREGAYRAAQRGMFPTYRFGKKIFVRIPEVLEALRQGPNNETSEIEKRKVPTSGNW